MNVENQLNGRGLRMFDYYEFFAGGGMVRAALDDTKWRCGFANDFDYKKGAIYQKNWGGDALKIADVRTLNAHDLSGVADLAWASFPCQDLSLAGGGAGLKGDRSGTFWPFWQLMTDLVREQRGPRMITLENVCGTLTSHGGKDFVAICSALHQAGYVFGALVIDAALFVPQSRPRLFVIAVRKDIEIPASVVSLIPSPLWQRRNVQTAYMSLPQEIRTSWIWWSLPRPAVRTLSFADLIEDDPSDVEWHTPTKTQTLVDMMSDTNRAKVDTAKAAKRRMVGTIYKRTRPAANGTKVQRAEVRFDNIAGCLRTPAGGSSRQTILIVDGRNIRSRLISGRETARLMGLPDNYQLPEKYNDAYHLTGDGVVVPVVRHLADSVFAPILKGRMRQKAAA
jgi:DNA (cytosine-5)-methyltransferase 1